ncbi:unnamed protein product [Microthlaspi erraticum]|uniref:Uncharacterized protein n=1 Tax=Microthlaspi erraticum TaxID=1685480 RepID=A0A6D2JXQ3_9BRAS|nr:unnamed protein product [Microthlaspi erraticum]
MRTKAAHDKLIRLKDFKVGDSVLLYNSKLRLFPGKLRSKWAGPFKITKFTLWIPHSTQSRGEGIHRQVLGRKATRGTTRSSQEQARSSEANPVEWSAPDGRLPLQTTTLPPSSLGGTEAKFGGANSSSIELGVKTRKVVFWSILEHMGQGAWRDLAHGRSSTGYAKEEGRSHLEDQLDRLLDQPVEFLNSTGQASTRSS